VCICVYPCVRANACVTGQVQPKQNMAPIVKGSLHDPFPESSTGLATESLDVIKASNMTFNMHHSPRHAFISLQSKGTLIAHLQTPEPKHGEQAELVCERKRGETKQKIIMEQRIKIASLERAMVNVPACTMPNP
jgi:hypothetical protein